MKKLILAAAALLFALNANAQLGIVAGVTSTATDIESAYQDIAVSQSVNKYHAGLVYKLELPMGLFVQPGVVYNMKGQSLKSEIDLGMAKHTVDIDCSTGYLEVPVRLGLGLDFGVIKPFAFVEPYAGYAITTETKSEFASATEKEALSAVASGLGYKLDTSNDDSDKWDGRDRLEYGVGAGAGVLLFGKLSVSAKYYWDMGNMFTEENQSSVSATAMCDAVQNQKCSGISASVILYF